MSVRHYVSCGPEGVELVLRKLPWWFRVLDCGYWLLDRVSRHRMCIHDAWGWSAWEERLATDHRVPLADDASGHAVAGFLWGYDTDEDGE